MIVSVRQPHTFQKKKLTKPSGLLLQSMVSDIYGDLTYHPPARLLILSTAEDIVLEFLYSYKKNGNIRRFNQYIPGTSKKVIMHYVV